MSEIVCDMAGVVAQVLVGPGDRIEAEQQVAILESMKMQIPVKASRAGTVREVRVAPGDFVNQGDVLLTCE